MQNIHLVKKLKTKRERRIDGAGDNAQEWEGEWVEVELYDAQAALQLLGRGHKLFTDNLQINSEIEKYVRTNLDLFTDGQLQRISQGEDPLKIIFELLRDHIKPTGKK